MLLTSNRLVKKYHVIPLHAAFSLLHIVCLGFLANGNYPILLILLILLIRCIRPSFLMILSCGSLVHQINSIVSCCISSILQLA